MKIDRLFSYKLSIALLGTLWWLTASARQQPPGSDTVIVLHFAVNSSVVDEQEAEKADSFFRHHRHITVTYIRAHTDTVGGETDNLRLSEKRSQAVTRWLVNRANLPNTSLIGYFGETRPVSKTDNALNRRVEIGLQFAGRAEVSDSPAKTTLIKKYSFDKLYFRPDEPILENFSLRYMDQIAGMLKSYRDALFEIRGHVNCSLGMDPNSGYMKKMNQLSLDRARVVYELLVERGLPAGKMVFKGMGNTEMIYPYAVSDEEKRKNMRVEILVLKDSL